MLLDEALQRHCRLADCPIACEVSALSDTLNCIDPTVEAMALTTCAQCEPIFLRSWHVQCGRHYDMDQPCS